MLAFYNCHFSVLPSRSAVFHALNGHSNFRISSAKSNARRMYPRIILALLPAFLSSGLESINWRISIEFHNSTSCLLTPEI